VLFPTIQFAVFFPIVFILGWLLRPYPTRWKVLMVIASFVFYGWWDWNYTFLLGASIVANHLFAKAILPAREPVRKVIMFAAVAVNLGVLGYFKYYGFFVTSVVDGFGDLGIEVSPPLFEVILPIGISFFTFQALSYVIDTYRGKVEPVSLLDFATYLSFFPHLVAGPIVRASEFLPQLKERPDPRFINGAYAIRLIVAGLFLKVVVSSYLAGAIVDEVFAAPANYSSLEILFAIYGYAFQIYSDFAGYTNIAIGIALLLGVRFPPNFNAPYTALSLQDFWRRWHMTLSRFLRDYLYIPMGGSRGSKAATYRNLMLTMLIGGLWHGAAWTFVVWGGIHGTGLAIEHFRADRRQALGLSDPEDTPRRHFVEWLITFNVVCLAWVFFRSPTFDIAFTMLERLFTAWGPAPLVTPLLLLTIGAMLASQFVPEGTMQRVQATYSRMPVVAQGLTLGACFFVINALGPVGVAPFIYFQF
jgi:D-alanyl-lipoteichoic acid acyltransferase DltB (MBOAT superfamily)